MIDKEMLSLLKDQIKDMKKDLDALKTKMSDQIGKIHARIDAEVENRNKAEKEMIDRDNKLENRIGWMATVVSIIVGLIAEIVRYIITKIL